MNATDIQRLEVLNQRHSEYARKACDLQTEILRLQVCAGDRSIPQREAERDMAIIRMRLMELRKWIILGKKEIRDLKRKRARLEAEANGLNPKDPHSLIVHASALLQRLRAENVEFEPAELGIVDALSSYLATHRNNA